MATVTIKIAPTGTHLNEGGKSLAGHVEQDHDIFCVDNGDYIK